MWSESGRDFTDQMGMCDAGIETLESLLMPWLRRGRSRRREIHLQTPPHAGADTFVLADRRERCSSAGTLKEAAHPRARERETRAANVLRDPAQSGSRAVVADRAMWLAGLRVVGGYQFREARL